MGKIYFPLPKLNNSAWVFQIDTFLAKFPRAALKKPFLKNYQTTTASSDETDMSGMRQVFQTNPHETGGVERGKQGYSQQQEQPHLHVPGVTQLSGFAGSFWEEPLIHNSEGVCREVSDRNSPISLKMLSKMLWRFWSWKRLTLRDPQCHLRLLRCPAKVIQVFVNWEEKSPQLSMER